MKHITTALTLFLSIISNGYCDDSFVIHDGLPQNGAATFNHSIWGFINGVVDFTGFRTQSVQVRTTFNGKPITQIYSQFSLSSAMADFSLESTVSDYASCDQNGCTYIGGHDEDGVTTPVLFFNVPYQARLGAGGHIGTYVDPNGEITQASWQLMSAHNNLAFLVLHSDSHFNGVPSGQEDHQILIDKNGNCLKHTFILQVVEDGEFLVFNGEQACDSNKSFLRFL